MDMTVNVPLVQPRLAHRTLIVSKPARFETIKVRHGLICGSVRFLKQHQII